MTLSINDLSVTRGNQTVISNFNLSVSLRSIALLNGPNGCGKSTLLDAIAALITPEKGSIELDGIELQRLPLKSLAHLRSYQQQRSDFILGYRVRELLELVSGHCEKRSRVRSIKSLSQDLDITDLLSRSVLELSGGERQRVSLAITLLREVPLYLFDEPLSAQDVEHSKLIASYLEQIARSGAILIIATHECPELERVANKVLRLK